jgi:hypothetical protein
VSIQKSFREAAKFWTEDHPLPRNARAPFRRTFYLPQEKSNSSRSTWSLTDMNESSSIIIETCGGTAYSDPN